MQRVQVAELLALAAKAAQLRAVARLAVQAAERVQVQRVQLAELAARAVLAAEPLAVLARPVAKAVQLAGPVLALVALAAKAVAVLVAVQRQEWQVLQVQR